METTEPNEQWMDDLAGVAVKIALHTKRHPELRTVHLDSIVREGILSQADAQEILRLGIDPSRIELGLESGQLAGFHSKAGGYLVVGLPPEQRTGKKLRVAD